MRWKAHCSISPPHAPLSDDIALIVVEYNQGGIKLQPGETHDYRGNQERWAGRWAVDGRRRPSKPARAGSTATAKSPSAISVTGCRCSWWRLARSRRRSNPQGVSTVGKQRNEVGRAFQNHIGRDVPVQGVRQSRTARPLVCAPARLPARISTIVSPIIRQCSGRTPICRAA